MSVCQGCGRADMAGITHVCPPFGLPTLAAGPTCPICWRHGGSHALGCSVERYIADLASSPGQETRL